LLIVFFDHEPLGGVDLGHRIGNFEIENIGRTLEPLGMFGAAENHAAIGALALEHAACVMQAMREQADLGVCGWHELAVEPQGVSTLVEGHRHGILSLRRVLGPPPRSPRYSGPFPLLRRNPSPGMFVMSAKPAKCGL
jgi:hypothetical protein